MKTLEELKQEMDTARAVYDAAENTAEDADDAWVVAEDVWRTARNAYFKKLKELLQLVLF